MNKYENGKIYKIEAINGDEGDIYIGSTTQKYLCSRMAKHRNDYKSKLTRSFKIFDKYGSDNCIITLLENVNCQSKDQLIARERFYIETLQCVNKRIEGRTKKEYSVYVKDKVKVYQKKYREDNKEHLNQYNDKNKERIKERQSKTFVCDCGSECWVIGKNRHFKTKKHQDFINQFK